MCYFGELCFFYIEFSYLFLIRFYLGLSPTASVAIWQYQLKILFHSFTYFKLYVGCYTVEPWQGELIPSSFLSRQTERHGVYHVGFIDKVKKNPKDQPWMISALHRHLLANEIF